MEIFNDENRSLKILNMLEESSGINEKKMSDNLRVSLKTLQNDIKLLNSNFKDSAYIKLENQKYSLYISKLEDYLKIKEQSYKVYTSFDSTRVRLVYIFKRLIEQGSPYLIDDLAFEMNISRTTLNSDLKKLKSILETYDLRILGKPNTGIFIDGEEKNIRFFIKEHVYNYIYNTDIFDYVDNEKFDELIKKYSIAPQIKGEFLKYLTISVDRYANECYLNFPEGHYKELLDFYSSNFVSEVVDYISSKYEITLNEDEFKFINISFATMRLPTEINLISTNVELLDEYKDLVIKILDRIHYEYGINVNISEIQKEFIYHIYFLMQRLKYGVRYINIMKDQIKEKYYMSYKISKTAAKVIYDEFSWEISEDELCYLAMYFETFFSNIGKSNFVKVALATDAGPAFKELMLKDLSSIKEVSKVDVFNSEHHIETSAYDFIVSTVKKEYSADIPVINQGELLDKEYIIKEINLLKYIKKMTVPTIKGMSSVVLSSINRNNFFLLDSEKTYSDNLEFMISELTDKEIVDEKFLRRIQEREKQSSTLFSENIAVPHTINKVGNGLKIILGLSKNGFVDNKELKIIFLVAVDETDDNDLLLTKTYEELISIIKEEGLVENISKLENYDDLIQYFIKNTSLYR
ncbi:MAG: PTS sugar transporter subunit IIA [Gemella sp.]|nr:PTS sugar transporter subunit IIA [Gemella sp.]